MANKNIDELRSVRKHLKKRKPNFIRQEVNKKKSLELKWRRPKGIQSKMRLSKKGNKKSVTKGYKSPRMVKGMLSNGLFPVNVNNLAMIDKVDPKVQTIIIGSTVGLRKKIAIIKKAIELNIKVANVKDCPAYIKEKELEIKKKASQKVEKTKEKEKKKKEAEAKAKKEEKTIDKLADDETDEKKKKEEEKKKIDKILTTQSEGY